MRNIWIGIFIGYLVFLLVASLAPRDLIGSEFERLAGKYDHVMHMVEFFFFGVLLLKVLSYYDMKYMLIGIIFMVGVVFLFEYAQKLVGYRSFSMKDIYFGLFGIIMAVLSRWIFMRH